MKNELQVAIVQSPLVWEDAQANRGFFLEKISAIDPSDIDLIVLPEMFSTGFTMAPIDCAETMNGPTVSWMREVAASKDCAITGSVIIAEDGNFYNRLLFVFPSGEVETYDKRHLFTLAGEHKAYTAGEERLVVEFRDFRICPLICYDLRFPVYSRNTVDYDILIYVANWPVARTTAWDILLKARAIENMSYVIGVNRVGEDIDKNNYAGHSQVIDYLGETIVSAWENEGVFSIGLDRDALLKAREKFGFLEDRDEFTVL